MAKGNIWLLFAVISILVTVSKANNKDVQEFEGPTISPNQSETILKKGQNYTLSCKSKFEIKFSQQEGSGEVVDSFEIVRSNKTFPGEEYMYEVTLELINVDQFAIGYYACFDSKLDDNDVLKLTEEPQNTAVVTYTYIYVDGTDFLFAPMREVIIPVKSKFVIECRPTTPDVNVTISAGSNKTPAVVFSPKIGFILNNYSRSAFKCEGRRGTIYKIKQIRKVKEPPQPKINEGLKDFLPGENFTINCSVSYSRIGEPPVVSLHWTTPKGVDENSTIEISNEYEPPNGLLYRTITIINATEKHAGKYYCSATNNGGNKNTLFEKEYLPEPKLKLSSYLPPRYEPKTKLIQISVIIDAYPPATFKFLRGGNLLLNSSKYEITRKKFTGDAVLSISNSTVADSDNYTLIAENGWLTKNLTFDVRKKERPNVYIEARNINKYIKNEIATLKCHITGYPLPDILWSLTNKDGGEINKKSKSVQVERVYAETAYFEIPVSTSGNVSCIATNSQGLMKSTIELLVYEIPNGFGIMKKNNSWFPEDQDVLLTCLASKYDYSNLTWFRHNTEDLTDMVEYSQNNLSIIAKLRISKIKLKHNGLYTCTAFGFNDTSSSDNITLTVVELQPLTIIEPEKDDEQHALPFQPIKLTCLVSAVPPPSVQWFKDNQLLKISKDGPETLTNVNINRTTINSTIVIKMNEEYKGTYTCLARNEINEQKRNFNLNISKPEPSPSYTSYLIVILVVIFLLIILVAYLTWKVKKEKRFRKELAEAGLLYFKEGATQSLNTELGVNEQAELLPYDERFEFPPEKLEYGIQLGAGAFGVVYKAEAHGIINAEEKTIVAVKTVKKNADNMYIKALASELKILVHLGKHVNIVNLLGACTKNVGKRELVVIVEYCKFGNIHNYMQKHRDVFIDQLTDNKEKNLGKINRGFSSSSNSAGLQSDFCSSNNSQETDHTFINSGNTNKYGRKASEEYVTPEWRSNYRSDYSYDNHKPRPLTSRDLLAWAFQIASGMEYLAKRKVLHGDLAARNVLLAEDNIIKICDFGLARSIYKNDEYHKEENSPLPVKWLAIECITDRIFSTQSDVWSFGIVLWELFSLAKTPYPNIAPNLLLKWLSEGRRMEKPQYADDRLYNLMLRCWEQKPTARPSFTSLQEILGSFLEDSVRNYYLDLNNAFTSDQKNQEQDYLDMLSAPDYKNMVTPSPHHYVNDTKNFFPSTPTRLDEEGYLQMTPLSNPTIFSPRGQSTKFDFDNHRDLEASSVSSELTPMLTINNLSTRGSSDSEHEGTAPYLKMCTRIDEETDDVFTDTENTKNTQNTAVTNPIYITYKDEKKPNDIINNINYINVPNGLVK